MLGSGLGLHVSPSSGCNVYKNWGTHYYVALRTPTKGKPLGTYKRNMRESQGVKGLRSKLCPKETNSPNVTPLVPLTLIAYGLYPNHDNIPIDTTFP